MSIAMNLFVQDYDKIQISSDVVSEWLDRTTLDNKELTNFRGWFHTIMVFIFTFLTIYSVQYTRKLARKSYNIPMARSKHEDSEYLK